MANDAATIKGIDITAYTVKDAARAKKFYTEVLGLKVTQEFGDLGCEFTLADGATFGIWQLTEAEWRAGNGVMFAVADVKAAVEQLKPRGVKFLGDVHEFPNCFMAIAEDTEGNSFMLHQLKNP